jgi:hypothetical protein
LELILLEVPVAPLSPVVVGSLPEVPVAPLSLVVVGSLLEEAITLAPVVES